MSMRNVYLVLAIVGAIVPYYFFLRHFSTSGMSPGTFVSAVFANPAATGFTADLLITSAVFWVAIVQRRRAGKGPGPLPFIILNLAVGLSCAVPAYLYVNARSLQE